MSVWRETQTVETSLMVTLSQEKNSKLALRIIEWQRDCQQEVPGAAQVTSRMADLLHPGRWQFWPQRKGAAFTTETPFQPRVSDERTRGAYAASMQQQLQPRSEAGTQAVS